MELKVIDRMNDPRHYPNIPAVRTVARFRIEHEWTWDDASGKFHAAKIGQRCHTGECEVCKREA